MFPVPDPVPPPLSRWQRAMARTSMPIGIGLTAVYTACGAIAYLKYPTPFSPLRNWISDLGHRTLNPDGALIYNRGCGFAGVGVIAFFITMTPWQVGATPRQRKLLLATQALGAFGGFALLMSAIYSKDRFDQHEFWSRLFFLCITATLCLSFIVSWRRDHPNLRLSSAALITTAVVLFSALFPNTSSAEWVAVGLALIYVCVFGFETSRLLSSESHP